MSLWITVRDDVEAPFAKAISFIEGTTLGKQLEADVKSAIAELESVSEADLKTAVTSIGVAALGGLAAGGTTGAIEAGIVAAPAAFAIAEKDISKKTTSTLVTSIVNSLSNIPARATGTATALTSAAS